MPILTGANGLLISFGTKQMITGLKWVNADAASLLSNLYDVLAMNYTWATLLRRKHPISTLSI